MIFPFSHGPFQIAFGDGSVAILWASGEMQFLPGVGTRSYAGETVKWMAEYWIEREMTKDKDVETPDGGKK